MPDPVNSSGRLRPLRVALPADSPLFEGLNEEDLMIAHGFHDAETAVRQIAATLLLGQGHPLAHDRIVALVRRLQHLPAVWHPIFEDLIAAAERGDAPTPDPVAK